MCWVVGPVLELSEVVTNQRLVGRQRCGECRGKVPGMGPSFVQQAGGGGGSCRYQRQTGHSRGAYGPSGVQVYFSPNMHNEEDQSRPCDP
jgi:hypothetical protein